jgi:hypothetical protein
VNRVTSLRSAEKGGENRRFVGQVVGQLVVMIPESCITAALVSGGRRNMGIAYVQCIVVVSGCDVLPS